METALREAIDRQQLWLYYQPIVSLATSQISAFDALVRWPHPDRGLLSAAKFIPVAEKAELIIPITRWTLKEACRHLRIWKTQLPADLPLGVNVHFTAKHLAKQDLLEEIPAILSENGLTPRNLTLEIAESQIMEHAEALSKAFSYLSDWGIRVCVDNFGTGYSSLRYLASYPIHALKIDRSFVRNLFAVDKNPAIVRSIVSIGHNLGFDLIAEGVERAEQLDFLRTMRCQYAQGYYFSPAVDDETVARLLTRWFRMGGEKKVELSRLRAFEWFGELDDEELAEIPLICEELSVQSGTVIFRQGQVGNEVYLMEEGSVAVYLEETGESESLAVLDAPTVFGEMAILNPERVRTASVKALTNLRLLSIPATPFVSFLGRFPTQRDKLQRLAAQRSSRGESKIP